MAKVCVTMICEKSYRPSQTWHVFEIDDSVPYNSATGRDFEPAVAPSRAGLSMASTGKLVLIQCAVLLNCCETHKHAVFQIVGVVDMPFSCAGVLVCSCSPKSGLECGSVEEDTVSHGRLRSSQRRHFLECCLFPGFPSWTPQLPFFSCYGVQGCRRSNANPN
jgi:hypothetical protein